MVQIRQTNMAIKRNVQIGCLAFLWALSPAAAQAFPVAEGAGALSSMVGIVTSVIVGFFRNAVFPDWSDGLRRQSLPPSYYL
jgi:hypothetical protein